MVNSNSPINARLPVKRLHALRADKYARSLKHNKVEQHFPGMPTLDIAVSPIRHRTPCSDGVQISLEHRGPLPQERPLSGWTRLTRT